MSYLCMRCGRDREEHDTNMVLESEEVLAEIGANILQVGYKMSLLTCCDSPRPSEYTAQMLAENYFFGHGAGYVSPDPAEETRLYLEARPMFLGHDVVMILIDGRVINIGL